MPFVLIASSREVLQQNKEYLMQLGAKEHNFTKFNSNSCIFAPDKGSQFSISSATDSILQFDGIFQQQILRHNNDVIARKFKNYPMQFDVQKIKQILGQSDIPQDISDEDYKPCYKEITMKLKA